MRFDKRKTDLAMAGKCMIVVVLIKTSNISARTLYKGLRNCISPAGAGRVARALGVDVAELIVKEAENEH